MNIKTLCLWLLPLLFAIQHGFASDTTYHKKPVYMSFRRRAM
jgi:hypothetical protein